MIDSVNDLQQMIVREQHCEAMVLPYLLKITKTDFGVSLGLDPLFWDGSYNKDGERTMIRLQDVIHRGAWKKHLERPQVHNLPPGFTIIHFSLMTAATDFTRFFLYYYSKRYKALPDESKWTLFNGARACAIWESIDEKIALQKQGIQAFACPWVYERIIEGRNLFKSYPLGIKHINGQAKAYRTSRGKYGYREEVAIARRASLYVHLNEQVEALAALPPPVALDPLPPGCPPFKLLEEPPVEAFALAGA